MVSAVDCGLAVNPDSVRAQIEGGINYALTPVLSGEISIKEGAVEQSNFHDYQVLRMKDAPEIQVHLVPGEGDPARWCGRSRSTALSACGSKRNFRGDRKARAAIAHSQGCLTQKLIDLGAMQS